MSLALLIKRGEGNVRVRSVRPRGNVALHRRLHRGYLHVRRSCAIDGAIAVCSTIVNRFVVHVGRTDTPHIDRAGRSGIKGDNLGGAGVLISSAGTANDCLLLGRGHVLLLRRHTVGIIGAGLRIASTPSSSAGRGATVSIVSRIARITCVLVELVGVGIEAGMEPTTVGVESVRVLRAGYLRLALVEGAGLGAAGHVVGNTGVVDVARRSSIVCAGRRVIVIVVGNALLLCRLLWGGGATGAT